VILCSRHKSWFVVATADMFIASTSRPDLVVARSAHGSSGEAVVVALDATRDYQAFEAAIIADYDAERRLSLSPASKPAPTLGVQVQVMLTRVTPPTIEVIPWGSTALIRAAYRGTSTMESLNGSGAMKLRYANRSCRRCLRSALVARFNQFERI
jgi:hypothetical protein